MMWKHAAFFGYMYLIPDELLSTFLTGFGCEFAFGLVVVAGLAGTTTTRDVVRGVTKTGGGVMKTGYVLTPIIAIGSGWVGGYCTAW